MNLELLPLQEYLANHNLCMLELKDFSLLCYYCLFICVSFCWTFYAVVMESVEDIGSAAVPVAILHHTHTRTHVFNTLHSIVTCQFLLQLSSAHLCWLALYLHIHPCTATVVEWSSFPSMLAILIIVSVSL